MRIVCAASIAVLATIFTQPAMAKSELFAMTGYINESCKHLGVKATSDADNLSLGICLGFMVGAASAKLFIDAPDKAGRLTDLINAAHSCLPENLSVVQLAESFTYYVSETPNATDDMAFITALAAWKAEFPCK